MTAPSDERGAHLVTALGAIRSRIVRTCLDVERDPQSVTLVVVTKTWPASDVATLARLGQYDIGESRDQEARAKVAALAEAGLEVRWHLVGRLQTNKARSAVSYAHAIHSVDRAKLATALAEAAERAERADPLDVFVQVSLDGDPDRGGVAPDGLLGLADRVRTHPQLRLRGVMAVAPIGSDPDAAFVRLAELSGQLQAEHPDASAVSAGMSGDFEAAVRHGATHVRVGSALLGRRGPTFS